MGSSDPSDDRSEIAFFDLETTVPTRHGQGHAILEFGAILVCPRKLEELRSYSTLVRPPSPSLITLKSVRCNGITADAVSSAPSFAEIADTVYDILHGRIWAGHNIQRFDCPRIREAFAEIGRPAPEPKGLIDSLALLTQKFGRRAGDMKMASLATYFGLGKQTHRSLDDVRMNLEVLKYCATVLLLESSLPDAFPENSWVSPNATTRSRKNGKSPLEGSSINNSSPSSSSNLGKITPADNGTEENNSFDAILSSVASTGVQQDPFDMRTLSSEMNISSLEQDVSMEENPVTESSEIPLPVTTDPEGSASSEIFLKPEEVSLSSIKASFVPFFRWGKKIQLSHGIDALQLSCLHLRVRFGLSTKFYDHAGRPRLSFVVDVSPDLSRVLDECDSVASKLFRDSESTSEWRPVVTRKAGYFGCPQARIHIPTAVNGEVAQYATEIYQKDPSGTPQKLVFNKFDPAELDGWFSPGTHVDAYFCLDTYDYQQSAGIRLVAKKLVICLE